MSVLTNITRGDLMRLQWYMLPRLKGNWIFFGAIALGVVVWCLFGLPGPITGRKIFAAVMGGLGGAIGGTLIGFLFNAVYILGTSTSRAGVLGEHHYEIRAEGLFERTPANEQLSRWSEIVSIVRSDSFILVRINGYLFHVIPRRSFDEQAKYEEFFEELSSKWRAEAAGNA